MDSRITSGEEEGKGGTVGGKFEFAGVETCGEEIGGMLGIGDVDDMEGGDGSGDKDALALNVPEDFVHVDTDRISAEQILDGYRLQLT